VAIAASFVEVFSDAILWVDPVSGTGILLGRRAGADEALGSSWPGLERAGRRRPLSDEQIRAGTFLAGDDFRRYARYGEVITDDNQLLAFSRMRPGTRGLRQKELVGQNYRLLQRVGGYVLLLRGG